MQETIWHERDISFSTVVYASLTLAAGLLVAGYAPGSLPGVTVPSAAATLSSASLPAILGRGAAKAGRSALEDIPFGLFGMPGRNLTPPFTSSMEQAQPRVILDDLAAAKARGARLVVNFAGGGKGFTDPAGHFDLDGWKARVNRFLPIAGKLNAYAADGTLYALLIIDVPHVKQRWGGERVPLPVLDQMAQYSKSIFPDLPTVVGSSPTKLQGYSWRYLDTGWAQYEARKGPVNEFAATEAAAARAEGLGLIMGLNISKGGDGSSGFGEAKGWSMTGKEIHDYGHALLSQPSLCAFISWDYRPAVVERPDVSSALQELADAAARHPATSCRQRGGARGQRSS
jgi:hypothetical protein